MSKTSVYKHTLLIVLVVALVAVWGFYFVLKPIYQQNKLFNMVNSGRHCRYVIVADRPIYCHQGELIFVSLKFADSYCDVRYIEKIGDSAFCVYNGYNSVALDSSMGGRRAAIRQSFRNRN